MKHEVMNTVLNGAPLPPVRQPEQPSELTPRTQFQVDEEESLAETISKLQDGAAKFDEESLVLRLRREHRVADSIARQAASLRDAAQWLETNK